MATAWDKRGAGGREYTPGQYERVTAELRRHVGRPLRTTVEQVHIATGVPPRTVRAVFSDADGVAFVIAESDDGVWVAEALRGHGRGTAPAVAGAAGCWKAPKRREAMAEGLGRRQGALL